MWWHYLIGYLFSIMGGHIFISPLISKLWKNIERDKFVKEAGIQLFPYLSMMLGIIERSLYTTSVLLGKPEFIGIWLALKVAGGLKDFRDGLETKNNETKKNKKISGRDLFNVFLIGNGFSIAYGLVGALLIEWLQDGLIFQIILLPLILIIGTMIFWSWAKTSYPKSNSKETTK